MTEKPTPPTLFEAWEMSARINPTSVDKSDHQSPKPEASRQPRLNLLPARPSIRSENKDTQCRNVMIYGHCRYENAGCAFNHDQNRPNSAQNSPGGQSTQSEL
ncbi:unnamed protein product [Colletotrichum noveboracense]|uniref:C3H1-type domain-containing protein n=1 Tax=Colletotrichum noveboracense TaxID=2664923 RepID=A0A9W4WFG5_9PEZI|nr:unnamed protein product [Colletotrichum noveboracense]